VSVNLVRYFLLFLYIELFSILDLCIKCYKCDKIKSVFIYRMKEQLARKNFIPDQIKLKQETRKAFSGG